MGLEIQEFFDYEKKFKSMADEFDNFIKNWVIKQAYLVMSAAVMRTPSGGKVYYGNDGTIYRNTGNMRESWTVRNYQRQGNTITVEVHNSQPYASFVEFGHRGKFVPALGVTLFTDTKWTDGQFILRIALDEVSKDMKKRFDKDFTAFLKSKGLA